MLKALELAGFKSFADRTRFDFPPGITVVVGPNGSGKSNIVDGLKWVLGEQSAKSLRGKDMADVIFKGSGGANGRKAANAAEATIILENADRRFPFDHDEIRVTRKVYRSGESEYLINNDPVRLKDIRDLFRGTGVGTDAYSLIEQGKVDRMLQSTSKDRRAIFEEAAGISRFKAKKIETQRRLARVEQNLIRLADIVEEVGSRYRSIKAQASKAARYRQFTQRLKLLRTHAARLDYTSFQSRIEALAEQSIRVAAMVEQLSAGADQQRQALQALSLQSESGSQSVTAIQQRVADLREHLAGIQSEADAKQQRATELQQRQQRLTGQLEGGHQRLAQLEKEQQLLLEEMEKVEAQHFDFRRQLEHAQPELETLLGRRAALEQESQAARQQHTHLLSLVADLASALAATQTEAASLEESITRRTHSLTQYQTQTQQLQPQVDSGQQAALDLRRLAEQNDSALAAVSLRIAEGEQQWEAARGQESELKSQQNGEQQRSIVIREMESRLEGVNAGVKQVLESARSNDAGPYSQVLGLVADLVQVDMQHATLIDVALGEVAQHVVIDGQRLIVAVANEQIKLAGRVGLLQKQQPTSLGGNHEIRLPSSGDVIGRADQMVQAQAGFQSFIDFLLGGTWIVKSLDAAIRLRDQGFSSVRFVTMSGEILEADGRVIVGAKSPANNLVSRRSELRLLQTQIEARQQEIDALAESIQSQRQQLEDDRAEHKRLLAQQKELSARLQKVERKLDADRTALQQVSSLRQQIDRERLQLTERRQSLLSRLALQSQEQGSHQSAIEGLVGQLDQSQTALQSFAASQLELEKSITTAKVKLAKVEQQLEQFGQQKTAIEQAVVERSTTLQEWQTELEMAGEEADAVKVRINEINAEIVAQEQERKDLELELVEAMESRDRVEAERKALVDLVETNRAQLKLAEKQKYESEGEINQLTMQQAQLVERLRDDYGLEIEQVLAYQPLYLRDADPQPPEVTPPAAGDDAAGEGAAGEGTRSNGATGTETETSSGEAEILVPRQREAVDGEIHQLRRKINSIGAVNLDALAELEELETRFNNLDSQYQDLVAAKDGLEKIIHRINADSRRIFAETLEIIRTNFQQLYRKTFGGGHADIVLDANEDILECGVDIVATPPGKSEFNNSLLSGGEKALTAVSLLMAIFKYRPSPFCVLDEVDAPFDEANIGRFIEVLKDFLGWTRFVIVTHSKKTMTAATTLYGVTMQDSGVSKRVSIKFEEVSEDGEILLDLDPAAQATQ